MRDIALSLFIFGFIPVVLNRPWIGVLLSAWISIMNPHRFTFGFAYNFQFAMIMAVVTVLGMLFNPKEVRLPLNPISIFLMLLMFWMTVTLLFALEPDDALEMWLRVMKTFLLILIGAALLHSRKQLEGMLWVLVFSVGFFGVKGGIFTIVTGGGHKVWGPPQSFIEDNNAISIALVMILPLMYYLAGVSSKWLRRGLFAAMFLCGMAVLGTQSRGAFLAILAMMFMLWLKSKKKFLMGILILIMVPVAIGLMPETWTGRMKTIETYEEDSSAQQRLGTWAMLTNLANDRPLVGGGMALYSQETVDKYSLDLHSVHTAHSIYFQMLGEHGYIGLALFLSLGIATWTVARRTIKASSNHADFAFAGDLARAIQVSLIGFAVGGAFVNIAYSEIIYYEIVVLMAAYYLVSGTERNPGQGGIKRTPTQVVPQPLLGRTPLR